MLQKRAPERFEKGNDARVTTYLHGHTHVRKSMGEGPYDDRKPCPGSTGRQRRQLRAWPRC
jgi:hypothetical protein